MTTPELRLSPVETQGLVACLNEEAEAHDSMLSVLKDQQGCLIRQDLDHLADVMQAAQGILSRIAAATERRGRMLSGFARKLGLDPTTRLEKLAHHADPTERASLEVARSRLLAVLAAVRRHSQANHLLAQSGLEVHRSIVHAIFGHAEPASTYDRSGRAQSSRPVRSCLDQEL